MSFCLYRCYAADGDLLYVGQTMRPAGRLKGHALNSRWWPEVDRVTAHSGFPDLASVRRAEALAIAWEAPRENVRGAILGPGERPAETPALTGLRAVMKEQGRFMGWLAREIGVSRVSLYDWANGKTAVPARVAEQVSTLLGVPAADLFERLAPRDREDA